MMKNRLWIVLLLITIVALVACQPTAGTDTGGDEGGEEPTEAAETGGDDGAADGGTELTGRVEVFSWWTAGGEATGLEALAAVFAEEYPDLTFENAAVAGGAGTEARAVLASRLAASDPPDSWQGHAGQEIIGTYVAGEYVEPLNDLYDENGWLAVMPETLIPLISQDGNIYSVPVNIHRANVLWYNPSVLEANSVEVPVTWDDFFAACETLEAAGVTCLAMGEQWTSMHLLETVMLGSLGADGWNALWSGEGDWASADVTASLDAFAQVLEHTNEDASSLSWDQAAQLVADGSAAFTIMGDWADGYYFAAELEPGVDYGWAPVPGTDGVFQFLSDSFVLPVGAPNPDGARAWLTVAGSKAGQEAFNPVKGSICARTDCDPELFNAYLKTAIDDWKTDVVVGSLTHGVVATDAWKGDIDTALGLFLQDKDVAAFQQALVAAAASANE